MAQSSRRDRIDPEQSRRRHLESLVVVLSLRLGRVDGRGRGGGRRGRCSAEKTSLHGADPQLPSRRQHHRPRSGPTRLVGHHGSVLEERPRRSRSGRTDLADDQGDVWRSRRSRSAACSLVGGVGSCGESHRIDRIECSVCRDGGCALGSALVSLSPPPVSFETSL